MKNMNYGKTGYDYRYVYICELQEYEKPDEEDVPDDEFSYFSNSTVVWKSCKEDSDCIETHVCVKQKAWTGDIDTHSGKGCAKALFCQGSSTWKGADGSNI